VTDRSRDEGATVGDDDDARRIERFLADLPDDQRIALGHLRETIAAAAPAATEAISYGVPAFKLHGRSLVSYGVGKAHCAFYLMSTDVMDAHRSELEGYQLGKGSIRFQADDPLPAPLVRTLVAARIVELEGAP
jgi:uncharacterized protein YdhG (YjbR/CyaY superfamily)